MTVGPQRERSDYQRIYALVDCVPRGRVATYGQIAAVAGLAGHARQVGYALRHLPEAAELPWHRVLNARGEISPRPGSGYPSQRRLLRAEGVRFDRRGRVDLKRFGWVPEF